jgi:cytochrome b561
MTAKNTELRYGTVAMTLHWLIAAFILINLFGGYYFNEILDKHDPIRAGFVQFHRSIGMTVLVLSLARLAWRLTGPVPPLPADESPVRKVAAHVSHFLLYFFMIAIPLAGWTHVSESKVDVPTDYFGLFSIPNMGFLMHMPPATKNAWHHVSGPSHAWLAYSAAALLVVHVGAALYHHFVQRDTVLRRMVPGTTV